MADYMYYMEKELGLNSSLQLLPNANWGWEANGPNHLVSG